jgi:hypothetical protein
VFPGTDLTKLPSEAESLLARLRVEARMRAGTYWFFWIAGLALLDGYLQRRGLVTGTPFGLGMVEMVESAAGLALPLVFVLLGLLARWGLGWSYALGMAIYAADAALLLLQGRYVGLAVHIVLLGLLGMGLAAARQLRQQDSADAAA